MLKSRLQWRILGNFALLLVILSAMTILTLNILNQMKGHFDLAASDIRALANLEQTRIYLADVPSAAEDYVFTGSPVSHSIYENGWKDFDVQINLLRSQLKDSTAQEDLTQLRNLFYGWVENVGDKKMMLFENGQKPDQVFQTLNSLAQVEASIRYLPTARNIVRSLYHHALTSQPRRIESAKTLSEELGQFVSLVNVLLAVFSLALGLVLTRSIIRPVRLLQKGTQGIMSGDYAPIDMHRSDEFGDLASDFNKMSMMLKHNYGRLQAYSELVTALNTYETLEEVETRSLELLSIHSGAAVGALYVLNEHTSMLEMVRGYALSGRHATHRPYKVGEGVPGQCAQLAQTMEVNGVLAGPEYIVDTGLVSVVPAFILAAPILLQEKVVGVLVLGSSTKFDELKKEIIRNSVPQIGIAIANAKNNEATQLLSRQIATKNEELNGKNEELQKAYRVKSDFLSGMSHELRTPLNSIIGFSSILLSDSGDPLSADQRRGLEKVLKNGKHLLQLINDILDFSKMEAGRMSVNVEEEDIHSVISSALSTVETMIHAKNLTLKQEIAPGLPILHTDTLKVKQILVNLMSNAAKFTDQGDVVIRAAMDGHMVAISIKDSGIGIAKENLGKVFEEFQQIENVNTKKYKGTGLGMPISRRLARLLGGDLVLESELGKGSTFTLRIPPTLPSDKIEQPEVPAITSSALKPTSAPASPPTPPSAASMTPTSVVTAVAGATNGTKILCIDDDPDVIEILRQYLVPEGYSVTGASSGDEGIRVAEQLKPALITLDIMMPQKDGWQVLRELKAKPATKDIPVLIHSMIDNKPLALHLGAMDVITKPVEAKFLVNLVGNLTGSKREGVLVIDDDKHYTSLISELLSKEGYAVHIASSASDALTKLANVNPSLILMDLSMPHLNGLEMITQIQSKPEWAKIPLVILSGRQLTKEESEAVHKETLEYISKSAFTKESFITTLRRLTAK